MTTAKELLVQIGNDRIGELGIKKLADFGKEFLSIYLAGGMGSLGKRDIDILVMHLIENYRSPTPMSNQQMSQILHLAETRVKNLRYEAIVRYPPKDDYVMLHFLSAFSQANLQVERKKIVFVLENVYVRNTIQARLKANGSFADSSFNSEILKVNPSDLKMVIAELFGKELTQSFITKVEKALKDEDKISFAEAKKEFIKGAAQGLGKAAVGWIAGFLP